MLKRVITLGLIFLAFIYVAKCLYVGWNNMEFGEFKPVAAVFLLDTSASNRNLFDKQVQTILKISKRLDSEDQALIYVVTEELIPESQTNESKDLMAMFCLIGFTIMMVLDVLLG